MEAELTSIANLLADPLWPNDGRMLSLTFERVLSVLLLQHRQLTSVVHLVDDRAEAEAAAARQVQAQHAL
jgi:hypothetical protein